MAVYSKEALLYVQFQYEKVPKHKVLPSSVNRSLKVPGIISIASSRKQAARVAEPFNEFLKTLKKPAAQDIVAHLKTFVSSSLCHSLSFT